MATKDKKKGKEKKENKLLRFYKSLVDEFRHDKVSFFIYITLRAIVTVIGVLQLLNGNYENAMLCIFTLVLFLLPAFVQKTFNVELPSTLEIIVLVFIFAAEILGELAEYYVKFSLWDTMLHTTTGFLAAAVGLSLVDQAVSFLCSDGLLLFFDDGRRFVGIF